MCVPLSPYFCLVHAVRSHLHNVYRDTEFPTAPSSYLQPRSLLEAPPPPLLPHGPLENQRVLAAEGGVAGLLLAPALGAAHRLLEQLAPEHVRQPHHPRAHRSAVAPVLALAPAVGDLLGEVPQPGADGVEAAGRRVAGWLPLGGQAQPRRDLCVSGLDDLDDAFLLEPCVGVL